MSLISRISTNESLLCVCFCFDFLYMFLFNISAPVLQRFIFPMTSVRPFCQLLHLVAVATFAHFFSF